MVVIEQIIQILVVSGMVISALFAVLFKDLLSAVIAAAIMSLLLALEFYILQAPDVAMAEAAVGAGVTTALFILVISKTDRMEEE